MDYWKNGSNEPPTEFLYLRDSNALLDDPEEAGPDDLFDDPAEVDPDNLSDDPETNAPLRSDRPDALPKDKRQQHISKEEELRLIALAQGNNLKEKQNAIAALLEAHTGFLRQKVLARKRYFSANITPEDLLQDARMGLMRAIEKFDPERGNRLTTYAGWWVEQFLGYHILKNATTQSVAAHLSPADKETLDAYRAYMKARRREKGDEPLSREEKREIHDLIGKWPHEIDEIRASVYGATYSLNTPIGDDKEGETFLDTLTKSPFTPPDALASDLSDRRFIETLIAEARLTERECDILFARLGIGTDDEKPVTLEELGRHFDISRERVRQINRKILEKLRQANNRGARQNKTEIFSLETATKEACFSPLEHPAAPDSDESPPAEEQNHPEEITTTTSDQKKEGDDIVMETKRIRTLAEAEKHQSELRPLPTIERDGYTCLTASALQTAHSMYQIALEIQKTGKPIVFFDKVEERIRGIFVLPEMADRLVAGTDKQSARPISTLRTEYYACIDSARKDGVLWLREGGGDQHVILALLPPKPDTIKLPNDVYEKNVAPNITPAQTQDTQMEKSPVPDTGKTSPTIEPQAAAPDPALAQEPEESASEQTALPVPVPEDKEPEASPAFLMQLFQPETLLGDPDPIPTYDLPDPRDLTQTLRTLFAAVSDAMDHPKTPVRIEYPNGTTLVSADPNIIGYLSYQAESEGNTLKIEASDTAPRDREPIMLVASFAGAAKGCVCIVPVDGTHIAFFPDDGRFESAQFMQAVLNHAFPQPQGTG